VTKAISNRAMWLHRRFREYRSKQLI